MTTPEKCEAILKKMFEFIDETGEDIRLEYDFGDYTGTIYKGEGHTHVGIPGEKTEENWHVLVNSLYNSLHGGPGLSWHKPTPP